MISAAASNASAIGAPRDDDRQRQRDPPVIVAPSSAYHVHAQASVHHAHETAPVPASMPISIAVEPTRVVKTPVRNAPRTGPAANESTSSPASRTDRSIHCAPSATAICAMPQPMVASRDIAHERRLVGVGADVLDVEVVDRRRGQRVDRRRQRGGHDRGDDEPGDAGRQRGDDEERQDLVVSGERARQRQRAGSRRRA